METATLSTYDQLILKGKIEGKIEGKTEHALLVAEKLMQKFPDWSDHQISEFSGATLQEVSVIRAKLRKSKPTGRKNGH